jgi:hypothetical protein
MPPTHSEYADPVPGVTLNTIAATERVVPSSVFIASALVVRAPAKALDVSMRQCARADRIAATRVAVTSGDAAADGRAAVALDASPPVTCTARRSNGADAAAAFFGASSRSSPAHLMRHVSDAAQVRAPSACCAVFFAPDLALLPPRRPCRPYRRLLAAVAAGARRVDARRVLPAAAPATASARRLGRESVRPDADRPLRLPVHRSLRPRVRHQHACTALPQRQQSYGVAACVPRMLLAQARKGSLGRGSLRALVVRGASIGARTPLRARTREGAYVYVYAPGSGRYWICPCAGRL